MRVKTIKVASDFTQYPGGRFRQDGEFSGEMFRDEVLLPALNDHDKVIVLFDGTAGYPSSFLEEAFGGLVRLGFSEAELEQKLDLRSDDRHYETYRLLAQKYLREARSKVASPQ